jgi:hypothetical protein
VKSGKRPRNQLTRSDGLVPQILSFKIFDLVRAKSVLIRGGASTLPIIGPTTVTRITTDPTVYIHTEAIEDIQRSKPNFLPIVLDPCAHVVEILVTEETLEDALNLDTALRTTLAGAFRLSLDKQGLAIILADGTIPNGGEDPSDWLSVLDAVGSMLAVDQELPKAGIFSPVNYIARAKQVASTAGTWLGTPSSLPGFLDLETSSMSDGQAILGDLSAGVMLALRRDLSLEWVRFKESKSLTHLLVAYLRGGFYVVDPLRLYLMGVNESS